MDKSTLDQRSEALLEAVRACTLCRDLPLGPKPIAQFSVNAKILIVGQAPGRITHHKGIPFDDPSGVRLRAWLGLSNCEFYDPQTTAIVPMGFCFPGTGKSGDLPPRPECAETWRARILEQLQATKLTVIIGRYALDWHLPEYKNQTLTQAAKDWQRHCPEIFVLPHPSPRNNRWLKNNPWFESDVLPKLQEQVRQTIAA